MNEVFVALRHFFESRWHMLILLLLSVGATLFNLEHYIIPVFVLWIVFILVTHENFTDILLPILLLNAMAIRTIGQSTYHEKHLWLAIPAALGILLHFILFPRKPSVGKTFYPLCAVSLALLLGGVGVIEREEYFNVSSLYFVFFLGIGMIGFYLWMRCHMISTESYDVKERFLEILYVFGIFCAFSILEVSFRFFVGYGELIPFSWGNDISEMLLFAIPIPFYFARRHFYHFFVPFLLYAAMLPAMSLTAVAVGAVLLLLGTVYTAVFNRDKRLYACLAFSLLLCLAVLCGIYLNLFNIDRITAFFENQQNGRLSLFKEAWERFLSYPLFGAGMGAGNTGESVLNGFWTHNYLLQILGSMGIIGALAYGYQFVVRMRLAIKRPSALRLIVLLSYAGIFLASMLQPGEFCPMPYELLAVALFVVLERDDATENPRVSTNN